MAIPRLRFRILSIALIAIVLTRMFRYYQLDDSLIYARYIRNALLGRGLVYNPGEHVNALTSPLFSALMLLTSWLLHGHVLLAENVLFCLFFIGACAIAERLVPFSGLLVASTAYFYTLVGMETSLFLFLIVLLIALYLERKDSWIPLVATLLILTRMEGGALVLVVAFLLLKERRFPRWRDLAAPALLIAAYFTFNEIYYLRLIPSSGLAKLGQARSGYWGPWPQAFFRLPAVLYQQFRYSYYLVPFLLVLALWTVYARRKEPLSLVVLPFCAILGAFYILCNLPAYQWYYAPFIFVLLVYAAMGVPRRRAAQIAFILVILEFATGSANRGRHYGLNSAYMQAGLWLARNTPKDARVACIETGTVGWYSDRYIYDIIGLTTPRNAVYLEHHDLDSWLAEDKPDYVVMHPQQTFGEAAAVNSPDYTALPVHFGPIYLLQRKTASSQ